MYQVGSARIEVVHPAEVTGDFNNGSIAMRIVYGDVAVLLTGDAEAPSGAGDDRPGHDLRADSFTLATTAPAPPRARQFLAAVRPKVAVYSAGVDNSYGHPHAEVIERLRRHGVRSTGPTSMEPSGRRPPVTSLRSSVERTPQGSTLNDRAACRGVALPGRSISTLPPFPSSSRSCISARPERSN